MAQEKFETKTCAEIPQESLLVNREEYLAFLEKLIVENISSLPYSSCVSGIDKDQERRFYTNRIFPLFFHTAAYKLSPVNNLDESEKLSGPS